jgi:uncharacterized phosphosugar-binding protein
VRAAGYRLGVPSGDDTGDFGAHMREHLARVEAANADALEATAAALLRTISSDGLIHVAGTGHSTALVLETFYRAGGLACVKPIYEPRLSPLHGALASTEVERMPGLGRELAAAAQPQRRDSLVVFSNSGVNATPVEIATTFADVGAAVVAVVSRQHMAQVPARAERKLGEVAHIVLDTHSPYGDAAFTVGAHTVAALSSLTSIYLWNVILARLAARADASGVELATWRSANTAEGDAANTAALRRYRARIVTL